MNQHSNKILVFFSIDAFKQSLQDWMYRHANESFLADLKAVKSIIERRQAKMLTSRIRDLQSAMVYAQKENQMYRFLLEEAGGAEVTELRSSGVKECGS